MQVVATLKKPYLESERKNFIIKYNHNLGYTINETDEALEAIDNSEEKEKERITNLYMTRSDFFDGTIKAFGADADDLLTVIENVLSTLPIQDVDKKIAINNYKNALNFYRKHSLFALLTDIELPIGEGVAITSKQWDKFFDETSKRNPDAYKELLSVENV